jgi:hypothetical protein
MENPAATPASSNVIPAGHAPLTREDIRNPHTCAAYGLAARILHLARHARPRHARRNPRASCLDLYRDPDAHIETLTHSYSGSSQAAPRRDPPAVRLADRRPADPNERELISDPRDRVMRSRFASRTSMSLVSSNFARFRVQPLISFAGAVSVYLCDRGEELFAEVGDGRKGRAAYRGGVVASTSPLKE